jgi:hypothetical protein
MSGFIVKLLQLKYSIYGISVDIDKEISDTKRTHQQTSRWRKCSMYT